jgi:hypothetical protein
MLCWLFGSFVLVIAVIRMLRNMRAVQQLRERRNSLSFVDGESHQRPSDEFREQTWAPLCNSVATAAAAKLRRPLSSKERRLIWRSRTRLVLESILPDIEIASDPATVETLLKSLPSGLNRPDPKGWCDQ